MRSSFFSICFSLFLVLLFASCSEDTAVPPNDHTNPNPIDLSNPEVGQKSYFQSYTDACGGNDFELGRDTLVLELVEVEGKLNFRESYTPGSDGVVDPIEYSVTFENDYFLIPERFSSSLFFFYANDTIHLSPQNTIALTQENCRIRMEDGIFIGNDIGVIDHFNVGSWTESNRTVVSCEPILAVDAYIVYDQREIRMSHQVWQNGVVVGWRSLESLSN